MSAVLIDHPSLLQCLPDKVYQKRGLLRSCAPSFGREPG
jgi:hypothetical protein